MMKITKEQLNLLVEKTVKQLLNEAPKSSSQSKNLMKRIEYLAQNLTPQEIGSVVSQLKKLQTQKSGAGASDVEVGNKVRDFFNALNAFMSKWDWDGANEANPRTVTSRLKTLEAFDPAIAGQIAPLWKELLKQAKLASHAEVTGGEEILSSTWKTAQKLDKDIMKIIRPIMDAKNLWGS